MTGLLEAVRRFSDLHADRDGVARTPIPGLTTVRASAPSGLVYAISRPLVCLVLQGSKQVTLGPRKFDLDAGCSLLMTADLPTISRVTCASLAAPYYSLVLELDPAVIGDLALAMKATSVADAAPVRVDPTATELADAALRLLRLLDRPASLPVLQAQSLREMHYWLLAGRHGTAIRSLGWPDGRMQRVARAVALMRAEYTKSLPVARLAAIAGMSASSFHAHFRASTSLSPRQFQKQLRLIEARRLMLAEGVSAGNAAFAVGYESAQQFTRDYGRLFGLSPLRETRATKRLVEAAA